MGQEKSIDWRQIGLLGLVIVMGLGLTFSATRESVLSAEQQAKSDFQARANLYVHQLRSQLQAGLTAAQDLYDYYTQVEGNESLDRFRLLVRTNSNLNKNRHFVAVALAMDKTKREVLVANLNRIIFGGSYKIWQPEKAIVDETDIQFPLVYTWSPDDATGATLLGLNVAAEKAVQSFIDTVNSTMLPAATILGSFPELDGGITGSVFAAMPFYSKNQGEAFLLQLINLDGVIADIAEEFPDLGNALELSARTDWGDDNYSYTFGSGMDGAPGLGADPYLENFQLGASNWQVLISAKPEAFPVDYDPAMKTATVCLLLTGLFFFIVYSQLKRAQRVADIVNRRTRALKEAHDELEEHYKLLQNLNKDVEEARRIAELANRAKSEFLATMSHELRTPLNAILGFSQLLREQALGPIGDERYIEYSKDIHSSGSHLLSLINDILDLAKLEAGKINIEKNVISSRQLAERVTALLSQQAEGKGIELVSEFEENMPDRILGDELRLRQIMINLISNAVKFTHEGSVTARLFAKSFQNGREGYVIEVQDTGIGIPDEKQATLFDRFTQVDAALSRRHGGVGLGLAICRELVDRMEGRISVRSMVNVGTAIRVHLPLEYASVEDEEDDTLI